MYVYPVCVCMCTPGGCVCTLGVCILCVCVCVCVYPGCMYTLYVWVCAPWVYVYPVCVYVYPGWVCVHPGCMYTLCVCVCVCVPVLRVRLGPAVLTGCDFPSRAVQPRPQQVFGDDLPDSQDGEQPGPSRRKRQPSMSETMPLYTLCKEDLESMDKEVSPRCPLATGGGSVGRDWSVCGQRRRQLSDPTWGPWCPACGLWAASQRRL